MIAAGEKAARVAKRPVVIEKDSFLIGLDNLSEGKKKDAWLENIWERKGQWKMSFEETRKPETHSERDKKLLL